MNEQTTKTEDIAPRDIETVVGKMTDEKVNTVFASVTVSRYVVTWLYYTI